MARKFGVEIEHEGSRAPIVRAFNEAGLGIDEGIYSSQPRGRRFALCPDTSVRAGGELKSPVLDFGVQEDRDLLTAGVQALAAGGGRPCNSAGIHIHISTLDLTIEQLANIARFFIKFEDAIYRIASSGWGSMRPSWTSYCPPISSNTVMEQLPKVRSERQLSDLFYGRRVGLNLGSHWNKGTVEFRIFNSSINPKRIQAYVAMCHQIVMDAELGNKRSLGKRFALGEMASGVKSEASVRNYFFGVLSKPSSSNRTIQGMSKADLALLSKCWKDSRPQQAYRGY